MRKAILCSVCLLLAGLTLSACTSLSKEKNEFIPVLMYHHLSDNEQEWGSATISPTKFKEDLLYLKTLGFQTILPEDLLEHQQNGSSLPENPILITFDDGYKSNYTVAYPLLKELDMKAVINVIVSSVGQDMKDGNPITPHFSWEEAKEMLDSGLISIQHHTYNLHNVGDGKYGKGISPLKDETNEMYINRLREDIVLGERAMEEHLGKKPFLFAYPYGVFSKESEEVLQSLGYTITLTVKDGVSNITENQLLLNRINMPQEKESPLLMEKLLKETKQKKEVPFKDVKDAAERMRLLEELIEDQK